ncbi:hypothetical protein CC2G_009670 [Coprinopsis cinerea AmutBmut pab1-1]|nr:hypothetical protein CC2G_009670 [Coprinopsis cinerea AmutBmut pab1-1]
MVLSPRLCYHSKSLSSCCLLGLHVVVQVFSAFNFHFVLVVVISRTLLLPCYRSQPQYPTYTRHSTPIQVPISVSQFTSLSRFRQSHSTPDISTPFSQHSQFTFTF